MEPDEEWVADVKRWIQDRPGASPEQGAAPTTDYLPTDMMGYEAAHPALSAQPWHAVGGDGSST